jgi:transcriptional regulator with XRE-family HTH domain
MATDWSTILLQVRATLGLTQKDLGELLGRDRRTIQRWEDRGGNGLSLSEAEILATAVRPEDPALADTILEEGRLWEERFGHRASAEAVASILEAAARAGGMSVEAVKPVVKAALEATAATGCLPAAVVAGMDE